MVKSVIFDTRQLLWLYPEIPHYRTDLVCFKSNFGSRTYPLGQQYFNRELTMVLILNGESEICINGESVSLRAGSLLLHGADYLTRHDYSSSDIEFFTLYISEEFIQSDVYLNQFVSMLLATLRDSRQYVICMGDEELQLLKRELEDLISLLCSGHAFLSRRILSQCNAIFLDIADILSHKTLIKRDLSNREKLLQHFHILVMSNYKSEHNVGFYADCLSVSKQYLTKIVKDATGKTVSIILEELLVTEACALLLTMKYSISEIASELNFSDTANFCRFFKRCMGKTPLEYRSEMLRMELNI